jgi:4-hydroxy-4-methyl-2-oxoglutarate aldolase
MDGVTAEALLPTFRSVDTCAVSDALDRLGLPPGVAGLNVRTVDGCVAGRAVTVQLGPAGAVAPTRHLGTAAIEAAGPDDVLVIAHGGRLDCSGWGGLLSLAASLRQVEGVVVDGACRDVTESRDLNFAVFARGATPVTARGRVVELGHGGPVPFDRVMVEPGDFVVADANGVTFIPAARAKEVAELVVEITGRESAMGEALRRGESVSDVLGVRYEQLARSGASWCQSST